MNSAYHEARIAEDAYEAALKAQFGQHWLDHWYDHRKHNEGTRKAAQRHRELCARAIEVARADRAAFAAKVERYMSFRDAGLLG